MKVKLSPALPLRRPPLAVRALMLIIGFAQFFVYPEPGVPEFIAPVLLFFVTFRAILRPVHLLLLAGNAIAILVEAMVLDSIDWSLISLYLTAMSIALVAILDRFDRDECIRYLAAGGALGAATSLVALGSPFADQLYRHGIRFTGFFKDPNVAAPTALFFAIICLHLTRRWRFVALFPLAVFCMALSRAAYLAAIVAGLFALVSKTRWGRGVGIIIVAGGALFAQPITEGISDFFQAIGRRGLVNDYDQDRAANWNALLEFYLQRGPLGPGFSEANEYSAHSTYLRILVEQGVVSFVAFAIALWLCWRGTRSLLVRTALLAILVNGLVIDATHWRVLFIGIALAVGTARVDGGLVTGESPVHQFDARVTVARRDRMKVSPA